jgi:hypothetical protein
MGLPMFQIILRHGWRPVRRLAFARSRLPGADTRPTQQRVEVCPPASGRVARAPFSACWRERLGHWIDTAFPSLMTSTRQADSSKVIAGAVPIEGVRCEFARSLNDIRTEPARDAVIRIRSARSLHELWHLRLEVFNHVARQHDQAEATRRLALLNRHFPTRAPRSGFGALRAHEAAS